MGGTIQMERDSNFQMLSWFTDQYRMGNLDLEPPYQRKSIWNNDYKVYFIDTILRNFPCPTIFLAVEISPGGLTKYHVVDGKQRLLTVFEFVNDEFTTSADYSDPDYADKYFSQLPDEVKPKFWGYKFTIEYLKTERRKDLNDSFDRLNRNVARLNKQELRHARHAGAFITYVTQLSDDPFWKDMGQSTTSRIRRMLDIEYVSEIFLVVMHGIKDGREHLDDYYAWYDEEIPDLEENRRKYEVCKNLIANLNLYRTRYRNLADQYSLWSVMSKLYDEHGDSLEIDIERTRENLLQFAPKVQRDAADERGKAYALAVLQASNSIRSRQIREDTLKGLIIVEGK
ncbi:MAG: DUF262 domain-containing protein [Candidatus Aminicenantes bacterium]|nr:MAG: DUF262 domain-containing protein [Candidatus Aminicenantes bacterium]